MSLHRRAVLQAGAATLALQATPAGARTPDETADRLLASTTEQLLSDYPESATGAGVDKNARARLRSRLSNRSASGQGIIRGHVRSTLSQLRRLDVDTLSAEKRVDIDVVKTVYELAAGGFEFPYGDVAILNNNWSYRNTPYAVAQNVGAFVEIPSFLDSSHSINTAEDVEAYLTRMEGYARQLEGETVRVRADAARGVVLPNFLLEKTLQQLRTSRAQNYEQWGIVRSLTVRAISKGVPASSFLQRSVRIAERDIAPALDRQIAMLESLQRRATSDAGVWKLPRGDEYYAWALSAGTTTTMTPDEVHEMGLDDLRTLHGRMDPILRSIGYTEGSAGVRRLIQK